VQPLGALRDNDFAHQPGSVSQHLGDSLRIPRELRAD
jgi:hypothetical protein